MAEPRHPRTIVQLHVELLLTKQTGSKTIEFMAEPRHMRTIFQLHVELLLPKQTGSKTIEFMAEPRHLRTIVQAHVGLVLTIILTEDRKRIRAVLSLLKHRIFHVTLLYTTIIILLMASLKNIKMFHVLKCKKPNL